MNAATLSATSPWYRQRWPWLLIAGPAIVVVAGFVTLWLAIRSDDGLVADDYYRQGLAINRTIERAQRAADLRVRATVDVAPDGAVVARIVGQGELATPPTVRLAMVHPTQAGGDRKATLTRGEDGRYTGRVAPPAEGRWQLVVETDAWKLPAVEAEGALTGIEIVAAPDAR